MDATGIQPRVQSEMNTNILCTVITLHHTSRSTGLVVMDMNTELFHGVTVTAIGLLQVMR